MHDAASTILFSFGNESGLSSEQPVSLDRSLAPDVFEGPVPIYFQFPKPLSSVDVVEHTAFQQGLHHFFTTGEGGGLPQNGSLKPALLAPFFRSQLLGNSFPVWIPDYTSLPEVPGSEGHCWPVDQLLQVSAGHLAEEGGESGLLKPHLGLIGRIVRQKLDILGEAVQAGPLWVEAFQELQKELQLKGVEGLRLSADLNKLQRILPQGGFCVPCSPLAHLALFAGVLDQFEQKRVALLQAKAAFAGSPLHTLHASDSGDLVNQPAGDIAQLVNDRAGKRDMTGDSAPLQEIREEVALAVRELQEWGPNVLLGRQFHEKSGLNYQKHFPRCRVQVLEEKDIFGTAQSLFEEMATRTTRLVNSLKKASSILHNADASTVGHLSSSALGWEAFTEEEMALCPPVIVLIDAFSLSENALGGFCKCLFKGYPIKVLATFQGGAQGQTDIAAIAVAMQKAFVLQSAALDPNALLGDFFRGLANKGPAFFHVFGQALPGGKSGGQSFLHGCAALESRVFPALRYDPKNNLRWGQRFELVFNPQQDRDWPLHQLEIKEGKGSVQTLSCIFTAVDYAALDPSNASGFKVVPSEYWTDELVPLETYPLDGGEQTSLPFIWMADDKLELQKVVVALPLLRYLRNHLDSWRFIQENSGIHNCHAERALEAYKTLPLATADEGGIRQVAAAELEAHATAAVKEAMEKLAATLLDFPLAGFSGAVAGPPGLSVEKTGAKEETVLEASPVTPAETDPQSLEKESPPLPPPPPPVTDLEVEAWIDSPLCTSCSECVDNFPQIFSYNADKQAFVASPRGGPYADIVRAAERCPVSIIHPGTPWDRSDSDLMELTERARPFQ